MSKLDELKSMVADLFANATEKEQIEKAAVVNNKISEVEAEQTALLDKNKELLDSYREVVLHTSVKPNATSDQPAGKAVTFEDSLSDWLKANKK